MNLSLSIPSNDNNIIDPCVACGESAASRDGLCAKCDHDVMAHYDAVEFPPALAGAWRRRSRGTIDAAPWQ